MRSSLLKNFRRSAAVFAFAISFVGSVASAQCSTFDLTQTSQLFGHRFGAALANHGDSWVVGTPGHFGQGQAEVHISTATGLVKQGLLWPFDLQSQDGFGSSVAIYGDIAVVGSPGDDDIAFGSGSAYVFQRFFGFWVQTAKLHSPAPSSAASFGSAVATNGDWIVIGAPLDSGTVSLGGRVEFFERNGTSWVHRTSIVGDKLAGRFGSSVSISGDFLAAGQPGELEGRVRMFERIPGKWTELSKLAPDASTLGAEFGCAVSIEGDELIVGARSDSVVAQFAGAAYLYSLDSGAWIQGQRLQGKSPVALDRFGASVDIEQGTAIIGAPGEDNLAPNSGRVHVFSQSQAGKLGGFTLWAEEAEFGALAPEGSAGFGLAVALRDSDIWVGSPDENTTELDTGVVHAFTLDPGQCTPIAAGPAEISVFQPETIHFQIYPGKQFAGKGYFLLGTTGGTAPGVLVGGLLLPLNLPNLYGDLTISQANQGPYQNTLAYLDADGKAHASIDIASIVTPLAVGQILHHAYFVFDGGTAVFMSDPVETQIVF